MLEDREFKEQVKMELFEQLNTLRTKVNLLPLHYDYFLEDSMSRYLGEHGIQMTSNRYEFIQAIGVYPYTNQVEFDVLIFKQDVESFSDKFGSFIQKNSLSVYNQNINVLAIELLIDYSVVDSARLTMVVVLLNNPLYIKEIGTDIDNLKIYGVCLKEGSSLHHIEIENMDYYDDSNRMSRDKVNMKVNSELINFNLNDNSFYAKIPKFLLKENSINSDVIKLGFFLAKSKEHYNGTKYGINFNDKPKNMDKSFLVFEIAFDLKSKCLQNRYSFGLDYTPEIRACKFFLNTPHKPEENNNRKSRSAQKPTFKTAQKMINKLDLSNPILQKTAGMELRAERPKKLYYFSEKVKGNQYLFISKFRSIAMFRKHLDAKYLDSIDLDFKTIFENKTLNNFFGNTIKHLESTDFSGQAVDQNHFAFKNYYQSTELSDLVFEGTEKAERKSHKLVMLSVSPFFAKLLKFAQGTYSHKNTFDFNKATDKDFKDMQNENFQIGYRVDKIVIPAWLPMPVFDVFLKFCYHRTLDINSLQKIDDFISLLKFSLITASTEFLKILILRFLQRFDIFALDKTYILSLLKFLLNDNLDVTSSVSYYVVITLACVIRLLQLPQDFLLDNQTILLSFQSHYIEDMLVINKLLKRADIDEILIKTLIIKQQRSGFSDLILKSRSVEKLNNTLITAKERFKLDDFIQILRDNKDHKQYLEVDLFECGMHIAIEENTNKMLYDNMGNQVKASLLERVASDDSVFKVSINNIKKGSLVIGNVVDMNNIKFYTLFYVDQTERLSIFFLKDKSSAVDSDMFLSIDLHIKNQSKEINQSISLIAKLSHSYLTGADTNLDVSGKGAFEVEVTIRDIPFYSVLIDYVAMNFDNIEFSRKAKDPLANIDFTFEPLKLDSDDVLTLDYMDLFYIFRNRNLFLRDEKTLLIFTVLYIERHKDSLQKRDLETLLLSIKFEYIDFELLLKLVRDNKTLADVEAFKNVLIRKLRNQEQLSSPRKFYKIKRKEGSIDLYERLIDWVLNEDHHEACNFLIKQQADTIDELRGKCEYMDRKLVAATKELNSYKKKCEVFEQSVRKRAKPAVSDQSSFIQKGFSEKFCVIF